ncbi:hypothetical protein [Blastococcus xanthinilyticus]|uniref:Uncharacterized protein n=1 Tax=Blastococcus xanthinilyticus TaxID=1564164 RepID=A0A5S5CWM9_9ACTN|nr:hypothetical protein [Blastococcus xanthinilyticus]TYP87418.1 hypothetical protein BD833_1065 [Blastococcus xanthinilyticus]
MRVLFVSVNQSYESSMSMSQLARCAERAWPISLPKAQSCDRVVAVFHERPLASWEAHGAYLTDEVYSTTGGDRARVGVVLGDPVPLRPEYFTTPALRRGVAVIEF